MKEFFKKELETLQAKTGIRQFENIMAKDNWQEEIDLLIDLMLDECNKPPFHLVRPEVKQRVISRAIVEDVEFIGLNAKFVRKALNAWWLMNGDRVLQARDENHIPPKVELDPESNARVDVLLESFKRSIQKGVFQQVGKMELKEAEKEGAEWKSEIERKGHVYSNGLTKEEYEQRKKLQRAASEFYKGRQTFGKLETFQVGGIQFMAESEEDALKIYTLATK
jgi:hypothetical protein